MARKIIQLFRNKTVYTSRSAMLSAIIKDDEGATFVGDQSLNDGEGIALRYKNGQKTITEYGLVFNDSNVKKIQLFPTYDAFASLSGIVSEHSKTIQEHGSAISKNTKDISTNKNNISTNTSNISNLSNRMGKAETAIGNNADGIKGNSEKISGHETKITGLTTRMGTAETNILKNETAIGENKAAIEGHTTDISGLTSRMDTAESGISANKGNITKLTTRMGTAESGINTNADDIKKLNESVSKNATDISTNASDIDQNTAEIGKNKTDITELKNSRISAITVNGKPVTKTVNTAPLSISGESDGGTTGGLSKVTVSTTEKGVVTLASYVNVGTVPATYGSTSYTDALAKTSHVKTYVETAINSLNSTKSTTGENYISSITQKNGVITGIGTTAIPHHTARLSITQAAKGTEITSESGDHPWINLTENGVVQSLQLVGGNNMNITVDAKGHIQFDSSYTNTTYTAGTGIDISSTTISLETAGVGKLGGVKAESATVDSSWTKARINAGYVYYQDTDTHYKATHVLSKTQTGKVNESSESTEHPFLNIVENGSVTSSIQIIGQQGIETVVETADEGKIALLHIRGTEYTAGTGLSGSTTFSLNKASKDTFGGVIIGDGINVNSDGKISATYTSVGAAAETHSHDISEVTGLQGKLDAKSDDGHGHKITDITDLQTALNSKLDKTLKGAKSGLAELDSNGKVPSSQLPSYVDDVIEGYEKNGTFFSNKECTAKISPETGKIYVDMNSKSRTYRWSGSKYILIASDLVLGTDSSTAYRGDYGNAAYQHSLKTSGNPHHVTKSDVGLGNVEDKSSATIRGELTKANVTTALGYTPPTVNTNTTYKLTGKNDKVILTPDNGNAETITVNNVGNAQACSGNAATATRLKGYDSVGSNNRPIFFVNGAPAASTFTIDKSVPSNAVFTDHTYSAGNGLTGSSTFSVRIGEYSASSGYMDDMLKADGEGLHISNVIDCGTF